MGADALTRHCLTLFRSLQTLSWSLEIFYVLIYWLLCIFSETISVGTNNSLSPTSHTDENPPPFGHRAVESILHHPMFFPDLFASLLVMDVQFT